MKTLGWFNSATALAVFIALVTVAGCFAWFIGGFVVAIVPLLTGLLFGRFVLGMNPILLLGAIAGAQTSTPSMAAVQARCGSPLPVLGYAPAYPVAQIALTLWGSIIVQLMT